MSDEEETIRGKILNEAYDALDRALVEQVAKSKMTYTEIVTVVGWLQQKVLSHMIKDIVANTFTEMAGKHSKESDEAYR